MQIVLDVGSFAMALTAVAGLVYGAARGVLRGLDTVVERHTGPLAERLERVERTVEKIDRHQKD